jgi:hypothetical protein
MEQLFEKGLLFTSLLKKKVFFLLETLLDYFHYLVSKHKHVYCPYVCQGKDIWYWFLIKCDSNIMPVNIVLPLFF